jgi:hypothetical protein
LWLSFRPTFDPHTAQEKLQAILEYDAKVKSFVIYELYGSTDMVARMWLPTPLAIDQIEDRCHTVFGPYIRFRVEVVGRIFRHWVWGTEDPPKPDPTVLTAFPSDGDADLIRRVDNSEASPKEVDRFRQARLLAPVSPSPGLRFFLEVRSADTMNVGARKSVEMSVLNTLDCSTKILDKSLYRLTGALGYLISGRVASTDVQAISDELTDKINTIGQLGDAGGRTYTHICSRSRLIGYREGLTLRNDVPVVEEEVVEWPRDAFGEDPDVAQP